MKILSLWMLVFLFSACSQNTPLADTKSSESGVTDAFLEYKRQLVSIEQVGVIEQEQVKGVVFDDGFSESRYFVLHWVSDYCVDGYTVFQNCANKSCEFKFEWVEGVCE